jgi:predicted small secreted protein
MTNAIFLKYRGIMQKRFKIYGENFMKFAIKTLCVSLVLLSFGFLAGCEHTAAGFGQDMQTNGKKLEKSMNQ